jgi:hypothetical protein
VRQPPLSPDMASCNFFPSLNLKLLERQEKFDDVETNEIPKISVERCFQHL